jgi:NADH:ubiquinone oxidoreductase subunit 5 (subunit L)/multisubunit Na+/H+ antiporter MnhA subunit
VALSFIIVIGAIGALFLGILGIIQTDIKRVVAYSTLSQLGYMTVALGASAYSVAIFHLMTHAFFKALLFLGAGSVIIGMHHDQDIRNMGGLRKYMPITWITSLIGSLALIAVPFFSGFYSKDSIIEAVHFSNLPGAGFAYFAVTASVFVTALYSFRMYFLVFHGPERFRHKPFPGEHDHADERGHVHVHEPHETPWVVWLPLVLLAIPSVVIGYMTVALGASAYSVAVFHLMTHAFFKALLFLAAGSVIIGMHHDQDIRNMGGLRKYMPITWITSLVGSLALIAVPFFSGFYSKDSIIEAVHFSHLPGAGFAYFAVVASVFVTALYSFRLYFLVFHGEERFRHKPFPGAHDHADAHGHVHVQLGEAAVLEQQPGQRVVERQLLEHVLVGRGLALGRLLLHRQALLLEQDLLDLLGRIEVERLARRLVGVLLLL